MCCIYYKKQEEVISTWINGIISRKKNLSKGDCKMEQLLQKQCAKYINHHFLKPDEDWIYKYYHFSKTLLYKDNLHLAEKGKEKLALPIKRKTKYTIKVCFHKINTNKTTNVFSFFSLKSAFKATIIHQIFEKNYSFHVKYRITEKNSLSIFHEIFASTNIP